MDFVGKDGRRRGDRGRPPVLGGDRTVGFGEEVYSVLVIGMRGVPSDFHKIFTSHLLAKYVFLRKRAVQSVRRYSRQTSDSAAYFRDVSGSCHGYE